MADDNEGQVELTREMFFNPKTVATVQRFRAIFLEHFRAVSLDLGEAALAKAEALFKLTAEERTNAIARGMESLGYSMAHREFKER